MPDDTAAEDSLTEGTLLVGKRIKERRELLGLTQQQASERAGVGTTTWRNAEKRGDLPGPRLLAGMARVLGWNPNYMIEVAMGIPEDLITPADPVEDMDPLKALDKRVSRLEEVVSEIRELLPGTAQRGDEQRGGAR